MKRFIRVQSRYWGRCVYLSCEKGLWKDVIKYGNLIYEYTLDNDEKWDIQDYLSQAYFYQGNYERELFYRKRILDQNDYVKAYDFCGKALEAYYKKEKDFPLVNPIIYLLHQIFICCLCSSYELYKRLLIRKKEFEDGIKSNNTLAKNMHMVRFIETCSLTNRAIHYFENVEFLNSINLFHKAEKNIY